MTIRFRQTRDVVFHHNTGKAAQTLLVEFDTHDEYKLVSENGHAAAAYLTQLLKSLVGMTMPIMTEIIVPLKPDDVLPETRRQMEEQGLVIKQGSTPILRLHALLSHPEVDGHPLPAEMLSAVVQGELPKRVAKLVAREFELRSDRPPETSLELQ